MLPTSSLQEKHRIMRSNPEGLCGVALPAQMGLSQREFLTGDFSTDQLPISAPLDYLE